MFGISRTTLLYYDKIGLLHPTSRTENGYRFYEESAVNRLQQILLFKNAGVPLAQIKNLIIAEESVIIGLLMKQLGELNTEINVIKQRQQYIINILANTCIAKNIKNMDKKNLDIILQNAGIDKNHKIDWHSEFEKHSSEQHHNFLSMLGLSDN